MTTTVSKSRRLFQFSIRSVLILMIVVAVGLAWMFRPYTVEHHFGDGTLWAKYRVRKGWDGSEIAWGEQTQWLYNHEVSRHAICWGGRPGKFDPETCSYRLRDGNEVTLKWLRRKYKTELVLVEGSVGHAVEVDIGVTIPELKTGAIAELDRMIPGHGFTPDSIRCTKLNLPNRCVYSYKHDIWALRKLDIDHFRFEYDDSHPIAFPRNQAVSKAMVRVARAGAEPCPKCGKMLRTKHATKCYACGWHRRTNK